jgi:penicillin-binding protein 1A
VNAVREVMMDLGIDADLPHELAIALGTSNLSLLDLVKGYAAFANGGFRVKPIAVLRVVDGHGTVLAENREEKVRVLSEDVAYKMNVLLKGPTEYGTAKGASRLGYPVAGKTGTTSNYYDALFIGYSPHIITGVWVGFDTRASLGEKESGARVCLPIWMSFMGTALRRYPPDDFTAPSVFSPFLQWFQGFKSDSDQPARPEPRREPRPETRPEPKQEPWPRIY